ncbi:group-specific protein [Metabacillus fastidiosus]|uniref:group-specific protein n=1 Tax=Metabacillus fastidiosus TaxID=1458 RepID=UPI002E221733|nr:group-specific protein [Metabacillus fastidiosus]
MKSDSLRLRRIQRMAHEIMDEMHFNKEQRETEKLNLIIDNLSRAVGDLTDPSGNYSLDYLEEKVKSAHFLLFKNKKVKTHY